MALSLALTAPFFIAFIMIPDDIMRGVFLRGAFTPQAASASAAVLTAYGFGLVAIVLLRSAVASFQAQGDTRTPMLIALAAVAINVGLKIVLFKHSFGAPGLAAATAAGAWINLLLLCFFAIQRGAMKVDIFLWKTATAVTTASFILAVFALFAAAPVQRMAADLGRFANVFELLCLGLAGALRLCARSDRRIADRQCEAWKIARLTARSDGLVKGPAHSIPAPSFGFPCETRKARISRSASERDRPPGQTLSSMCPSRDRA